MRTALLSFLLIASTAFGQTTSLEVFAAQQYGISYLDGSKTAGQKWPGGQDTVVCKYAWKAWRVMDGMSYSTFTTRTVATVVAKDMAWFREQDSFLAQKYQNTYAYAHWPRGRYVINATVQIPRGGMDGKGSFWYAGNGSDHGQMATEFVMDDASWWPSSATERRLFETPNAGLSTNSGYNEGITIGGDGAGFHLSGPKVYGDGKTRIGLFIKRAGECSYLQQVRSDGFQYGFVFNDGVPLTIGTITAFYNEICGACGLGTALATINAGTISGDSNGELVGAHPGYGAAAGGIWNLDLIKSEEDVTGGTINRHQVAGYFEGQYAVTIGGFNFSNGPAAKPVAAFILNPTLGNGANQNSGIKTGMGKGFGYTTLVKNLVTGQAWTGPGDFSSVEFTHYAKGDKLSTGCPDIVPVGGVTPPPVDPPPPTSGITADASHKPDPAHPPQHAVDGNPATWYASGIGNTGSQVVGMTFTVNQGSTKPVSGFTAVFGPYGNCWPLTFKVETSLTGATGSWTQRGGTFNGAQNTDCNFPARVNAQFVKITVTSIRYANGPWLGIETLTLKP